MRKFSIFMQYAYYYMHRKTINDNNNIGGFITWINKAYSL